MAIINANVTTVPSSIYTSSGNSAITVMHFCNYSNNGTTANVYLVPNGKQANVTTQIYSLASLVAGQTLVVDTEKVIFSNGDAIYASADANVSVTATVSYIGI